MLSAPDEHHRRFMRQAIAESHSSPDPSRKVGALVVRNDRWVVGRGSNRFPLTRFTAPGQPAIPTQQFVAMDPRIIQPPLKYELLPHAEPVATHDTVHTAVKISRALADWHILPKGRVLHLTKGATMYITWVSCNGGESSCTDMIINNQYGRVICLEPEQWVEPKKWGSFYDSVDKLVAGGIDVGFIGRRFDATGFCLYPRLVTYDEIKQRDGHKPAQLEPIG